MENKKHKYQEELKQVAPNLSEIEKKEPFTVHNDYFNELSNKISDRIIVDKAAEKKIIPSVVTRYLSAAVFSVLVLAVTFIYVNRNENRTNNVVEIEITADDLIASVYLLTLDEFYIKETVAASDADLNILFVDNSEFERYLLEHEIDETLINEL